MIMTARTKTEAIENLIEAMARLEESHITLIRRDCDTRHDYIILRNQWISLRDAFTFEGLPRTAKMIQVRIDFLADMLAPNTWGV